MGEERCTTLRQHTGACVGVCVKIGGKISLTYRRANFKKTIIRNSKEWGDGGIELCKACTKAQVWQPQHIEIGVLKSHQYNISRLEG